MFSEGRDQKGLSRQTFVGPMANFSGTAPLAIRWLLKGGTTMNEQHAKGAVDKAKGAVKDAAGKLTGDKSLQAEGKTDKAKGAARNLAGDAKDAARNAADAGKH
jgi:uncharacterized protein YjbJ (UPF0337 family)